MARKSLSEEEILAQIEAARHQPPAEDQEGPRAVAARYDAQTGRVEVELDNGCLFAVPAELLEGVRGAAPEEIAEVEVAAGGDLHWKTLDTDLHTTYLLRGIFGSKRWMAELGRAGGRSTSVAKVAAARANGRKGGRPRKQVAP